MYLSVTNLDSRKVEQIKEHNERHNCCVILIRETEQTPFVDIDIIVLFLMSKNTIRMLLWNYLSNAIFS